MEPYEARQPLYKKFYKSTTSTRIVMQLYQPLG